MVNNIESTVASTRVRLARNLAGYNFPNRLSPASGKEIVRIVSEEAIRLHPFNLYSMDEISENVAQALCDDHLISADLAANRACGAALIDEKDEGVDGLRGKYSIMINEEDHLREQYIIRGFNLMLAYCRLSTLDDELSKNIRFAFDKKLGYLTACPTNLGTGLRASVMLFLPGLTRTKNMETVARIMSGLGHTVRGVFGEGSAADGYMYQISNEVTLGVDEDYILTEVQRAVLEIVKLETLARENMLDADFDGIKDECLRAFGILTNCYKISFDEFQRLISAVKLGAAVGFLSVKNFSALDELVSELRPANVGLNFEAPPTPGERDKRRAAECRAALKKIVRS